MTHPSPLVKIRHVEFETRSEKLTKCVAVTAAPGHIRSICRYGYRDRIQLSLTPYMQYVLREQTTLR